MPLMDRPPSGQTTPMVATFNQAASVKKDKRYALALTQTDGSSAVRVNNEACAGALVEDDNKDNRFT